MRMFNPRPAFEPVAEPSEVPKVIVPSFIQDRGQVANWLFHSGGGDVLYDFSEEENHGDVLGPTWVSGHWGWGLDFVRAESDGVNCGSDASLKITGTVTLTAWVYTRDVTNTCTIVGNRPSGNHSNYTMRFNGGEIDFYFGDGAVWYVISTTGSGISAGNPYRVTATYEFGTTNVHIYINGEDQTLGSWSADPTGVSPTTDGDRTIGYQVDTGEYLDGVVYIARIYDRLLSSDEESQRFNEEKTVFLN